MFPQLPSGNNPYVGSAAGAASAGASLANALASAANQKAALLQRQQQQQAVQDHQDLQSRMQAFNQGWVPAYNETRMPVPASTPGPQPKGMIDRTQPTSQGQDPARRMNIGGQTMYRQTPAEIEHSKLDDSNSFVPQGQMADLFEKMGVKRGSRIKPSDSHSLMMAFNEAQPKDEPFEYDASGKYIDATTGEPVPGFVGKKSKKFFPIDLSGDKQGSPGAAPGGPFDTSGWQDQMQAHGHDAPPAQQPAPPAANGASPNGPFTFALPEKAERPARTRVDLTNFSAPVSVNEDTGEITPLKLPAGVNRSMSPAQTEADKDRHARAADRAEATAARVQAAEEAKAEKRAKAEALVSDKHDAFRSREKDQWDLNERYQDLADPSVNPNGTNVILPNYNERTGEITEGTTRTMNEDLRQSLIAQSAQARRKAAEHHESAAKIRRSMKLGEFAPGQSAPPAAPGRGGRGAQAKVSDPLGIR